MVAALAHTVHIVVRMSNTSRVIIHRDGTASWWSVYEQRWVRGVPSDHEIASMPADARRRALAMRRRLGSVMAAMGREEVTS